MRDRAGILLAVLCFLGFLTLAFGDVAGTSPTSDEMTHLAAGWSYLKTGDFRLNPEHPPLVKSLAAVPLLLLDAWPERLLDDGSPPTVALLDFWSEAAVVPWAQWFFAHRFFYAVRDRDIGSIPTTEGIARSDFLNDVDLMFVLARGTLLIVIGGGLTLVIFLWSRELWGAWGAALSVALFSFDPNFIAHTPLVTSDAAIALLMTVSLFAFWRCCRTWSAFNAGLFVTAISLAHVAKFTAVLLWPMVIVMVIATRWSAAGSAAARTKNLILLLCGSLLAVWITIWAAYGFDYRATRQPQPIQKTVEAWYEKKARREGRTGPATIGLPGRAILLANRMHLLPEAYLYGFALVQDSSIFRGAYLRGEFNSIGYRSYFLWSFLVKTPIPTVIAIVAGIIVAIRRRSADTALLLAPVVIYMAVSVGSGLNIGHRHILPVYPFLFIVCGALSRRWLAAAALTAVSGMVALGNHLAYFNELAGGPRNGHRYLIDSNLDWGQDLGRLGRWVSERGVTEPLNLVYFGSAEPRYYGIRFINIEGGLTTVPEVPLSEAKLPGIFAISIHKSVLGPRGIHSYDEFLKEHDARLLDRVGQTILIYSVGKNDIAAE